MAKPTLPPIQSPGHLRLEPYLTELSRRFTAEQMERFRFFVERNMLTEEELRQAIEDAYRTRAGLLEVIEGRYRLPPTPHRVEKDRRQLMALLALLLLAAWLPGDRSAPPAPERPGAVAWALELLRDRAGAIHLLRQEPAGGSPSRGPAASGFEPYRLGPRLGAFGGTDASAAAPTSTPAPRPPAPPSPGPAAPPPAASPHVAPGQAMHGERLSALTGVPLEQIQAMRESGLGWGQIAQHLGVTMGAAMSSGAPGGGSRRAGPSASPRLPSTRVSPGGGPKVAPRPAKPALPIHGRGLGRN